MNEVLPAVRLEPLIAAAELAANSKGAVAAEDPRLDAAAAGASAAVRRYCRWHVTPVIQETLVLDVPGRVIKLPTMHAVDVDNVKLFGYELQEHEYSWSQMGVLELHVPAEPRFRALQLNLTHGYEEAPDLKQIASKIALFALASPLGVTREQAGQVSISWGTQRGMGFAEADEVMLQPYRLRIMP